MKYFRVWPDVDIQGRWHLGDIRHTNNWFLINPIVEFMEPGDYELDVSVQGLEMDHSFAGYADASVVSEKFRSAVADLPEVSEPYKNVVMERVFIEGQDVQQSYFMMIVETRVDCVDESKSQFIKYEANDPARPDRAGDYRAFTKLVIDAEKAAGWHIFRIARHPTALVFSGEVKRRLDDAGVTGIYYEDISG